MSQPRKSTLAKIALEQLNGIHEMSEENRRLQGNADANATLIHARHSAANYIKTIRAHDETMLPTWLIRNWVYFKTIGWHNDFYLPKP